MDSGHGRRPIGLACSGVVAAWSARHAGSWWRWVWGQSASRRGRKPNPLGPTVVTAQPIVFVVRPQYAPDHHNTETMFQTGEINTASFRGGSAIRTIDLAHGRGAAHAVGGAAGRGARHRRPFQRPAACVLDAPGCGGRLPHLRDERRRQRAAAADLRRGISDIDPIYLPDDRILFSSSREPKYCMCNRHIMCNLYTMDADGANIQQIGHSTLFEGHPSLLPDGRSAVRSVGIRRSQFRRRARGLGLQSGRDEPRHPLGQQHEFAGCGAGQPGDSGQRAVHLHVLVLP